MATCPAMPARTMMMMKMTASSHRLTVGVRASRQETKKLMKEVVLLDAKAIHQLALAEILDRMLRLGRASFAALGPALHKAKLLEPSPKLGLHPPLELSNSFSSSPTVVHAPPPPTRTHPERHPMLALLPPLVVKSYSTLA